MNGERLGGSLEGVVFGGVVEAAAALPATLRRAMVLLSIKEKDGRLSSCPARQFCRGQPVN